MKEQKELTDNELYNIGATYCAKAEHCRSEVRTKLFRYVQDERRISQILEKLVEERYIDESRYAEAFIHDKLKFARWGCQKIKQALWQKQIPESVYSPFLEEVDDSSYQQTLHDLLSAKRKSVKGANEYEIRMKLIRFALSRGFEMEEIQEALNVL